MSWSAMGMVYTPPAFQARSWLVANVPFAFCLGQTKMSAGQYEIGSISDQVEVIRDAETGVAQLLIRAGHIASQEEAEAARLVFRKYDGGYVLSEIWDGISEMGIQVGQSRCEEEFSPAGGPEIVVVAMQ